jgi:hypothetical protein
LRKIAVGTWDVGDCYGQGQVRKQFFFEKKNQKTFICSGFGVSGWAQPNEQKFFGSFFQKRTASFPSDKSEKLL